jgi:hypothetical protein
MPSYPTTTAAAQQTASEIARTFGNYQCVECGKAIARALGPLADATVIKLRVAPGRGGDIMLLSPNEHISFTGQHVGTRVGERVYDNLHPDGVPVEQWRQLYADAGNGLLLAHERPIGSFFGRVFRWREYANFASSRFQVE